MYSFRHVSRISPVVDPHTRTADVEVLLPNPDHRLKPGMFARIQMSIEVHDAALILPRDAIVRDDATGARWVFVVSNGKTRRARITQGLTDGNRVEITSGVEDNADVVIAGHGQLQDGDFVQIVGVVDYESK